MSTTTAEVTSGAVLCWGSNFWSQLGDGTITGALTPVAVVGVSAHATYWETAFPPRSFKLSISTNTEKAIAK